MTLPYAVAGWPIASEEKDPCRELEDEAEPSAALKCTARGGTMIINIIMLIAYNSNSNSNSNSNNNTNNNNHKTMCQDFI